ncbi:MAG: hypothetical protein HXS53_08650 [Theionarchaea archaeon]|nr:hypothetical protein [Theionarchaea archaeon]
MLQRDLSKKEKLLLQLMGKQAYLANEDLCSIIGYKYTQYVSTLQKKLQKREYLIGPLMFADFGRIFRNRVCRVYAFIMFDTSYNYIRSLLQEIDCWLYFYPLEEGLFRKYFVGFMCNDTDKLNQIFEYLLQAGIIHYYHLFEQEGKWEVINPTFLLEDGTDAPIEPNFKGLLGDVVIPDLQYKSFVDISLTAMTSLLEHLWVGRTGCNLKKMLIEEKKYREKRRKELKYLLISCPDEETAQKLKTELIELTGDPSLSEYRNTYNLLMDHDVLEKVYFVWPFPQSKCSQFILLLRCKSVAMTKRVMVNFGKNCRLFTRVAMLRSVTTGQWYGTIFATADPFLSGKLMTSLDACPEIEDRKLFPTRSFPSNQWASRSIPLEGYYNPETQILEYPYDVYAKKIRQRLEEEGHRRREASAFV